MLTGQSKRPAERAWARPAFRPMLDVLEDRTVPASLGTIDLPLDVSDLQIVGDQLQGVVNFAGQEAGTFTADLTAQDVAGEECPVLNLEIGAISLNLLGLHVDTSDICLDVTATDNQGLLGGLLCDLTTGGGLLDLGGIVDQLGDLIDDAGGFLDQLDSLLDDILGRPFTVDTLFGGGGPSAQRGPIDILNLSLGPVDLDVPLLGVGVSLDDCDGGPVTVDITADPAGGLLGSLLGGLAGGLDNLSPSQRLIDRVERVFDRLGDLAGVLNRLDDLDLSRQAERAVNQLTRQLERLAERVDSIADLNRFIDQVEEVTDRLDRIADAAEDRLDRIFDRLSDQLERILDRVDRLLDRLFDR